MKISNVYFSGTKSLIINIQRWVKEQGTRHELLGQLSFLRFLSQLNIWRNEEISQDYEESENQRELRKDLRVSSLSKEKAMAPHSSTLAWKIPWMVEPGRLQSMGSLRAGHDWSDSNSSSSLSKDNILIVLSFSLLIASPLHSLKYPS